MHREAAGPDDGGGGLGTEECPEGRAVDQPGVEAGEAAAVEAHRHEAATAAVEQRSPAPVAGAGCDAHDDAYPHAASSPHPPARHSRQQLGAPGVAGALHWWRDRGGRFRRGWSGIGLTLLLGVRVLLAGAAQRLVAHQPVDRSVAGHHVDPPAGILAERVEGEFRDLEPWLGTIRGRRVGSREVDGADLPDAEVAVDIASR